MTLNMDEFNTLTVVCDLLEKGTPETRIAKYLVQKYGPMSYDRVVKFVKKLKLSEEWERRILARYKTLYQEGITIWNVDEAQNLGDSLRRSAFYARRTLMDGKPLDKKR